MIRFSLRDFDGCSPWGEASKVATPRSLESCQMTTTFRLGTFTPFCIRRNHDIVKPERGEVKAPFNITVQSLFGAVVGGSLNILRV